MCHPFWVMAIIIYFFPLWYIVVFVVYKLYLSPSLYDPTCAPVPAHLRQLPHLPLCNAEIHTGVTGAIMWHTGRSLKKTCPLSQLHPSVVLVSRDQQQRKVFATAMNFKSSLADSMRIKTNKRMRLKLGKGKKNNTTTLRLRSLWAGEHN